MWAAATATKLVLAKHTASSLTPTKIPFCKQPQLENDNDFLSTLLMLQLPFYNMTLYNA